MAKGHCESGCGISIVGATACVKYGSTAAENLSMIINYLYYDKKVAFKKS